MHKANVSYIGQRRNRHVVVVAVLSGVCCVAEQAQALVCDGLIGLTERAVLRFAGRFARPTFKVYHDLHLLHSDAKNTVASSRLHIRFRTDQAIGSKYAVMAQVCDQCQIDSMFNTR